MKLNYKNKKLERALIVINALTAGVVAAYFVMVFGFEKPLLPMEILLAAQLTALLIFIGEKPLRFINAVSKSEFLRSNWFEILLLLALGLAFFGAGRIFAKDNPQQLRLAAVGIYLVIQVISKLCRTCVNMAASGKNPTKTLIASFLVLIVTGAGLLMLPKSREIEQMSVVDALFTATSATCVTGLVVKDTGKDFSLMGQIVILTLIQLGGLGIIIFGAVFALLLGQALTVRESVAMQDLLSAQTLGRIGNIIGFIFCATILFEAIGAISMFAMWDNLAGQTTDTHQQWFCSIFHSISAFCNAGFGLFSDSLVSYKDNWAVYSVIAPLIILGGLGFPVLYNITNVATDKIKRYFQRLLKPHTALTMQAPKRLQLQTKIVLTVSLSLIILGTAAILIFENNSPSYDLQTEENLGLAGALFQSITARTAGFNTVDISSMSAPGRFVLIVLMFIGGSPGSTAGGIKTVTLAVIIMTAYASLRKRTEVEMFKRSIRLIVVGRAVTVALLFVLVLFTAAMALTITERHSGFDMSQIMFETSSALGTVGLTMGITPALTTAGKLIIIATMLIGRLGPLTLLASLTFNLKPARYNYPDEAIIVG